MPQCEQTVAPTWQVGDGTGEAVEGEAVGDAVEDLGEEK